MGGYSNAWIWQVELVPVVIRDTRPYRGQLFERRVLLTINETWKGTRW